MVTANGVAGPEAMFSVTEATPALFERAPWRALAQNYPDGKLNGSEAPIAERRDWSDWSDWSKRGTWGNPWPGSSERLGCSKAPMAE